LLAIALFLLSGEELGTNVRKTKGKPTIRFGLKTVSPKKTITGGGLVLREFWVIYGGVQGWRGPWGGAFGFS